MPAMHNEAPRPDRDQLLQRRVDPVLGFHRVEDDLLRDLAAGSETYEFADRGLIGRLGKMHGDVPAPAGTLERGDRGLALEKTLGQEIDHAPRGLFVADRETRAAGAWGEGRGHQSSDHLDKS